MSQDGPISLKTIRCRVVPLLGPACALILLLVCFRAVLFGGEQFAYRDAAHFYYPLYLRIQQEWAAGRWPLWDPWQNAGMPLLGMPMSAVFYPGKILYAIFAYPWATRLYTIAHVVIAWAGMFALARAWRQSTTAAGLAAMAYAFGAPVLFQYCNVIFLVGAAWVPWGFLALEWLLHQKRRWGMLGLAIVLALQVLGGDPEAAYLTVLCGGGYALVLAKRAAPTPAWQRGDRSPAAWPPLRSPGSVGLAPVSSDDLALPLGRCGWRPMLVAARSPATPLTAHVPQWLPPGGVVRAFAWGLLGCGSSGVGGSVAAARGSGPCWRPWREAAPWRSCWRRCSSCRPWNISRQEPPARPTIGPIGIYGFCVEPTACSRWSGPASYGRFGPENQFLGPGHASRGASNMVWTPFALPGGPDSGARAGAGIGFRGSPPWRTWLLALVAVVAVAASFGRFGRPALAGPLAPGRSGGARAAMTRSGLRSHRWVPRTTERGASTACWRWSSRASSCSAIPAS